RGAGDLLHHDRASGVGRRIPEQEGAVAAHSIFTPLASTMRAHFGTSAAMKAAKSCGEPVVASMPSFSMLAFISGELSAALAAAFSLLTIAAGVPAGAHSPDQNQADMSGKPLSIIVGTSGSSGKRVGPHTEMARSLPSLISGTSVEAVPMLR